MTIPARLSVVSVGARDVPALRSFYEALGWKASSPGGDEFAAFALGGAVLGLYRLDLLVAESGGGNVPAEGAFGGITLAINVEQAEQVDEVIEVVRGVGGSVLAEPETRDWGGRSAYFADPEGNRWEVAWLPGSEFDARSALIWPY